MGWSSRRGFGDRDELQMRLQASKNVAQAAEALSQLVEARNKRVMGSEAGERSEAYIRRTQLDRAIAGMAQAFINSYFMPIFGKYWVLRKYWLEKQQYRVVDELDQNIMKFEGPYRLYWVIYELAMMGFDMRFDARHTISTVLTSEEEPAQEEEPQRTGPEYLAADERRIESMLRARYAARDRRRRDATPKMSKEEMPTFTEALQIAKAQADELAKIRPEIPGQTSTADDGVGARQAREFPEEDFADEEEDVESEPEVVVDLFEPDEEEENEE